MDSIISKNSFIIVESALHTFENSLTIDESVSICLIKTDKIEVLDSILFKNSLITAELADILLIKLLITEASEYIDCVKSLIIDISADISAKILLFKLVSEYINSVIVSTADSRKELEVIVSLLISE